MRYWSQVAQNDHDAQFEPSDPVWLRREVADRLVFGAAGNRDKPFWQLVIVTAVAGEAFRAGGEAGFANGFALLSLEPAELDSLLEPYADEKGRLSTAIGRTKLSRAQLVVLRKVLGFLLMCDQGKHAVAVLEALDSAAQAGPEAGETLRAAVLKLSNAAHAYRSTHFVEGQANATFDIVHRVVRSVGRQAPDDLVIEVWHSQCDGRAREYESAVRFVVHYRQAVADAQAIAAAANPSDVDATIHLDQRIDEAGEPETLSVVALRKTPLRIVSADDLSRVERLVRHWPNLRDMPATLGRLAVFGPIQSGISNHKRKPTAIALEDRVLCAQVGDYDGVMAEFDAYAEQLRGWVAPLLVLRAGGPDAADALLDRLPDTEQARAREILSDGIGIVRKSRSKALRRPADILALEARALAEELGPLIEALGAMSAALKGLGTAAVRATRFDADREFFAAMFSHLELQSEKPPLPAPAPRWSTS